MPSSALRNFANSARHTQNWYAGPRDSTLRPGRVYSFPALDRRIAFYRGSGGDVHALDARCPHLGADLGQGTVRDGAVQCAFHRWRFGHDGRCISAPGFEAPPDRCVRVYPTEVRWGLIWFFNGPRPLFPLPEVPDGREYRILRLHPRRIACHPHLVVGNGLDIRHLETLHGMTFTAEPEFFQEDEYRVSVRVQGRPASGWLRRLTGSSRQDVSAIFTTIGGNLAWATVSTPVRFHALFTAQPDPAGGGRTQVIVFLPRTIGLRPVQALALLYLLLRRDRQILEMLDFSPSFTALDAPLRALADVVNRMPVW